MIDWDQHLAAVHGVFGEPVLYRFADGDPAITIADATFSEAFTTVDALAEPPVMGLRITLGIRLSALPVGYDPEQAQGDHFEVARTGRRYVVKSGRPDGKGWAMLEANAEP